MRIAVACEFFYPDPSGSTPTDMSCLMRRLKDEYGDVEIDVITSRHFYQGDAPSLPREENWDGIRITRLNTLKSKRPGLAVRSVLGLTFALAALRELLKRPAYDALFVVTNPPTIALTAREYWRRRGVPYLYLIHDLYPDLPVALGKLAGDSAIVRRARSVQKGWLTAAASVVVLGRCMKERLETEYGLSGERVRVIANWADADAIRPMDRNTEFRRAHGLVGFVALYAGNFGAYMDFNQILDAAAILAERSSSAQFVLVGDGIQREAVLARVERERLPNVRVLPKVRRDEIDQVVASCDAALIPLDPAMNGIGVPSKLYTTLAGGRAIIGIVPPGSEVARTIEEAGAGINVPHGQPALLADAVERLMTEPGLCDRMGLAARRALESNFTLDNIAGQYHALLREIARPELSPKSPS